MVLVWIWCFVLSVHPVAFAKDEPLTNDAVVIKHEGAHRLLLPKDWPVEQKDGRLAPVPIEAYLSMKFGQVKNALGQTDQRMAALEKRVEQLEQDNKIMHKRLQVFEQQSQERR